MRPRPAFSDESPWPLRNAEPKNGRRSAGMTPPSAVRDRLGVQEVLVMGAMARVWRPLLAGLLAVHGLIHVMGFAATWHIGSLNAISSTPSLGGSAASSVS